MQKKICCFSGHSFIPDISEESKITDIAEFLITQKGVNEFWVGARGDFDKYASNAVCKLREKYLNIRLVYVLAYLSDIRNKSEFGLNKRYDEIIISEIPENTPMKYRIIKTNEFMVDNSSYLVCHIEYDWGGAFRTYKYAKGKKHIEVINLYQNFDK